MRWAPLINERGSTLVEAAVSLAVLIQVVSLGLAGLYFCFARVWLDRSAYEALICLSTRAGVPACERRLRDSVAGALPIGRLVMVRASKGVSRATIKLRFAISPAIELDTESSQRLPLFLPERA